MAKSRWGVHHFHPYPIDYNSVRSHKPSLILRTYTLASYVLRKKREVGKSFNEHMALSLPQLKKEIYGKLAADIRCNSGSQKFASDIGKKTTRPGNATSIWHPSCQWSSMAQPEKYIKGGGIGSAANLSIFFRWYILDMEDSKDCTDK